MAVALSALEHQLLDAAVRGDEIVYGGREPRVVVREGGRLRLSLGGEPVEVGNEGLEYVDVLLADEGLRACSAVRRRAS